MPSKMSWTFPYASQRMPVMAANMVATSHPLAAQAGLRMLQSGGNAVDAALAAAITLTVVEPTGNGIGSDAFAMVWDGENLHGLNASGRSPQSWAPDRFAGMEKMPLFGWDTVTVPGAVDAWAKLSERFGKLPFGNLFHSAISYAQNGFPVTPRIAAGWARAKTLLTDFPDFTATFLPEGRAPSPGQWFRCPDQARTLTEIADSDGESFYRGNLARQITAHAEKTGGSLTEADLATHNSTWLDPIYKDYHGIRLHEIPPNGQGIAALMALGILQHLDVREYPVDSADSIHLQVEAMKIAFAEAHRHVSDPDHMRVEPDALMDQNMLRECANEISMDRASYPRARIPSEKGTVYLTTADQDGMMVSYIQSNYMGFGSGIVVPGTGISLQGRALGFSLERGHPNRVDGGKRPYNTIIPGFVTRDGRPLMSFGVMGGHMQPQGHVQMVVRIFDYGQNPQTASDAPRWHVGENFDLVLEQGCDPAVANELQRRGHRVSMGDEMGLFGGAQLIYRLEDGYCGASDHRKDGQVVGY
jgi:gamma-glutamyltranspeptidase / glutathione hydrolase